jgi:hypothetical protein
VVAVAVVGMLFVNNYHEYVLQIIKLSEFCSCNTLADQDPFTSSHSLDTNPFDDPPQWSAPSVSASEADLRRREEDLERRETELRNKAEYIRRHGRNNFPPC